MKHSPTGPITRLVTRPIRSYFNIMAAVMLDGIKKDQRRPSSGKRLISWGGKENTPPPVSKSAMSPLGRKSEDPAERVLSPRASSRRTVRTSTPTCADSGNDSEGEMLPTYEVMMRETFSPISPTPLSPILPDLPDLIEEATRPCRRMSSQRPRSGRRRPPTRRSCRVSTRQASPLGTESQCTAFHRPTSCSTCRTFP